MSNWFAEFFLLHPKRLVVVGEALYSIAATLAIFGACASVYTGAVAAIYRLGHQVRSQLTLADLLPGLPTWWVPETLLGFVFVIAVAIVGAVIAREGGNLERLLNT